MWKSSSKWLARVTAINASCLLCGANAPPPGYLCTECILDLPWQDLDKFNHQLIRTGIIDAAQAVFCYAYPIDKLIQGLKYSNHLSLAEPLGYMMAEQLKHNMGLATPDLLLPVPLHRKRLQERGYNQSLEIARQLGRRLNISVDYRSCQRIRNTAPQTELSIKQRSHNVKGAFALSSSVHNQHIAIIDDVLTTGATVHELARVLKKAGAGRIEIWACACAQKT